MDQNQNQIPQQQNPVQQITPQQQNQNQTQPPQQVQSKKSNNTPKFIIGLIVGGIALTIFLCCLVLGLISIFGESEVKEDEDSVINITSPTPETDGFDFDLDPTPTPEERAPISGMEVYETSDYSLEYPEEFYLQTNGLNSIIIFEENPSAVSPGELLNDNIQVIKNNNYVGVNRTQCENYANEIILELETQGQYAMSSIQSQEVSSINGNDTCEVIISGVLMNGASIEQQVIVMDTDNFESYSFVIVTEINRNRYNDFYEIVESFEEL